MTYIAAPLDRKLLWHNRRQGRPDTAGSSSGRTRTVCLPGDDPAASLLPGPPAGSDGLVGWPMVARMVDAHFSRDVVGRDHHVQARMRVGFGVFNDHENPLHLGMMGRRKTHVARVILRPRERIEQHVIPLQLRGQPQSGGVMTGERQ